MKVERPCGERESRGVGGKDEVDVEGEGDGERGDVVHPSGAMFAGEEEEEEERNALAVGGGDMHIARKCKGIQGTLKKFSLESQAQALSFSELRNLYKTLLHSVIPSSLLLTTLFFPSLPLHPRQLFLLC